MATQEKKARDLKVGDLIIAKQGGKRYAVVGVDVSGLGGPNAPYLTLSREGGVLVGHDTAFDSRMATYAVETPDALVTCRECLGEFAADDAPGGICDDCSGEPCEHCDGTGDEPDSWGDDGPEPCDECGGDGVV